VLGGGQPDDLTAQFGVPVKALVPLTGQPMSSHVLRALRNSGRIERIIYIGPVTDALSGLYDQNLPQVGGMLENLEAGLQALPTQHDKTKNRVLVATADVPLLTAAAVRDLFDHDPGAGLVYPIIPQAAVEAQFPGGKRTYARTREGRFTGGNLFLLEPGLVSRFMPRLRQVIQNRKNPLALAGLIGLGALVKFVLGIITIRELEERVSRILGVTARALITNHAEIGFDVDKPEDLHAAQIALERHASGGHP
jgi:CTP:molybdopterin cytidylyltransferase MocA